MLDALPAIPGWFVPALNGFLLGLLIESIRHHRTMLEYLDHLEETLYLAAMLDTATELAVEEGHMTELRERFEEAHEEVRYELLDRNVQREGLLERAIRRWLM